MLPDSRVLLFQNRIKHTLLLVFTLFMFNFNNLHAAVNHSAANDWYTIESANFRVHYHSGEADLAKQTVNIAERVHTNLSAWIQWQPIDKTDLVLTDELDVSNGFATPFPSNRNHYIFQLPILFQVLKIMQVG